MGFKVVGRLSGDGKGTVKDPATGEALTKEEAAERLRLWTEMTTPDEDTKPADLSEQEQIDAVSRIQKEVREEKPKP